MLYLHKLTQVPELDDIYVYCSSEKIIELLPMGVEFVKREPYFDLSSTSFNKVLKSISTGINKVSKEAYDSAFSVVKMQEFLWKDKKPYNYCRENIPRTQNLEPLYTETCGLYVYPKELIMEQKNR